jgi:4-carboxymuconolactone decarboxylase
MTLRVDPILPGSRPELAQQEAQILAERGRISPLYQVLLNSPPIAHGWEQMLSAVRNRSSLTADLRELVILRVAILNRAPYEFEAHLPIAKAAGVSDAAVQAVQQLVPKDPTVWTPRQQLAIKMTDAMTQTLEVSDDLYQEARAHFDAQGQIDLVATIAAYNMVSRFLIALKIGH